MKKIIIVLQIIMAMLSVGTVSQNIELSFVGDNNGQAVELDSILIRNATQSGELTLYPPDLTLVLLLTGVENRAPNQDAVFDLDQNYPNPFTSQTSVKLHVPGTNTVKLVVSNLLGQNLLTSTKVVDEGTHTFLFIPGNERCYFLTANFNGYSKTIKMLCNPGQGNQTMSLKHSFGTQTHAKVFQLMGELPFELGDELMMLAYSDLGESGMAKSPEQSGEFVMQFATNIACPGLDSIQYGGQWYHTIQVGGQCWLSENMNIGEMISGSQTQTNNGIIEKYCYGNLASLCDERGGLYHWNELMQFSNEQRTQGICPDGWHIPTDEEFKILEGRVDSNFPIGSMEWEQENWRGFDAANNLKSSSGWMNNGNGSDKFDFHLVPTGYWFEGGFFALAEGTTLYSSTLVNTSPWYRGFNAMTDEILRNLGTYNTATAVRCIKN